MQRDQLRGGGSGNGMGSERVEVGKRVEDVELGTGIDSYACMPCMRECVWVDAESVRFPFLYFIFDNAVLRYLGGKLFASEGSERCDT